MLCQQGQVNVWVCPRFVAHWHRCPFPAVNAKLVRQYTGKRPFHPKLGHVASASSTQPAKQDWAPSLDSLLADRAWGGHPQLFRESGSAFGMEQVQMHLEGYLRRRGPAAYNCIACLTRRELTGKSCSGQVQGERWVSSAGTTGVPPHHPPLQCHPNNVPQL